MVQYNEQVERQKMRLEAEEWANGVRSLHAHQLKSMWYETRPQDTDLGPVMDVQYNDERVERTLATGERVILGKRLVGEALIDAYIRGQQA